MKKRKKPKRPYRVAASIRIKEPGRMTAKGARQVASWLRREADFLEKYRLHLADKDWQPRYLYAV